MKIVSLFTKNVFLLVNIFPFLPLGAFFLISGCSVYENPYNSVEESIWGYKRTLVQGVPELRITENWPKVDGATALCPLYASAYYALNVPPKNSSMGRDYTVPVSRTSEAYNRIINGRADIIFVAQPSEGQKKSAADANVKLIYTPFAREAFVFIVNTNNPVNSLTEQQIRDIFSGKITRWSTIGGGGERIQVWPRPADSGSQTIMLAKVMKDTPMLPAKESTVIDLMGGVIRKVADYQNTQPSIGYTFRYYATQMNKNISKNIKLLAVNGISPTVENIRNGSYPYIVDVYMVTREKTTVETQKMVGWFLSPQGQQLVQDVGYVPLYNTLH
ncbi:TPA: PstS family phosphate ABC transporter substrate-binding protein [Salmonella enterica subsp. enterica serovar Strathcona]|uniref:PstS family phosphate ABC transporter substrate-binding protein n=1 Tax=Salmonella enterica TaxID=28901 RepID=UPI0035F3ED69